MAIKKLKNGTYQIYVYDPATKKKGYIGVRAKHADAKQLERDAIAERKGGKNPGILTVREYAAQWLEHHHGQGTRRPSATTRQVNESNLRRFLTEYGDHALDSITRREALRWSKLDGNHHRAKTVSAMFSDALDDEEVQANPFANRRQKQARGRRDIHPLTESEVDRLASIALERWGPDGYGRIARAWVLFGAWVGTRPGETFGMTWGDLDLRDGLVKVRRVKPPYNEDMIIVPDRAMEAIRTMPRIANSQGLVFTTVTGKRITKGGHRYYWAEIRAAFRMTVEPKRWAEICEGQDDLDYYALRHTCASWIVANGGNEYLVAAQLGNTPQVARETYIHDFRDRTREQLRGLLNRPQIVDLDAARERKLGGSS